MAIQWNSFGGLELRKLLIWDGDETLWDGTILEGDNPVIPPARQVLCEELASRGVLQSIASRNKLEDVLTVLHRYEMDNYFLAPQADLLRPKSAMIASVMSELSLARQEDVAYVDDLPYNLAEVQDALPGVLTFLPSQTEQIIEGHFTKFSYTEEDRSRVRRYREEDVRRVAASSYDGNRTAFLRACGLTLSISPCGEEHLERACDLVERANRMSALDGHYTRESIKELRDNLYVGRVHDKYGDYGLSALVGCYLNHIYLLIISCRLQGKGIGSSLLGWVINRHIGKTMTATWKETQHNRAMRELYRWYDFQEEEIPGGKIGCTKRIDSPVKLPDWVKVIES